jgi:hypothetical protein
MTKCRLILAGLVSPAIAWGSGGLPGFTITDSGPGIIARQQTALADPSSTTPPADLVLLGGLIVTMDEVRPAAEALAVRESRILAVGPATEIRRTIGDSTEVIDLRGAVAFPGFIESHGHFLRLGQSLTILKLREARSWDEIVEMVAEAAARANPGEWILGRGWHQEKWNRPVEPAIEGFPVHHGLSAASPRNPVLLTHASGHAAFANEQAMHKAGVSRATPDPRGGEILRDASGDPTGLFRETASSLIQRAYDEDRKRFDAAALKAEARRHIDLATEECLSKGITSFQDAGSTFATIDHLRELAEAGVLRLRLWVMVREDTGALTEKIARYRWIGIGNHFLTVRAIKKAVDGALGSRGAWLLEPYADLPSAAGLNTTPLDDIEKTAQLAARHDFQLCVHAIGDRANREILDLYERTLRTPSREGLRAGPGPADGANELKQRRWRIEHAQHLHPADIPRFAGLGVIASMQGTHCTSDGPWVPERLGERRAREGAYVWRTLLDSGALICNGTDAPVEDVDPIRCFHATVTRRMNDGQPFFPSQRLTREEALKTYTLNAAYAAFEENLKGSLTPGKLADMTVLDRNILTVPDEEILKTRVLYTIVGGRIMYSGRP